MKKKRGFKRKKYKDTAIGLSVNVFNNNVEGALKILKKGMNLLVVTVYGMRIMNGRKI